MENFIGNLLLASATDELDLGGVLQGGTEPTNRAHGRTPVVESFLEVNLNALGLLQREQNLVVDLVLLFARIIDAITQESLESDGRRDFEGELCHGTRLMNLGSDLFGESQEGEVVDGKVDQSETVVAIGNRIATQCAALTDFELRGSESKAVDHTTDF